MKRGSGLRRRKAGTPGEQRTPLATIGEVTAEGCPFCFGLQVTELQQVQMTLSDTLGGQVVGRSGSCVTMPISWTTLLNSLDHC